VGGGGEVGQILITFFLFSYCNVTKIFILSVTKLRYIMIINLIPNLTAAITDCRVACPKFNAPFHVQLHGNVMPVESLEQRQPMFLRPTDL
jgi:hypothetical protein